MVLPEADVVEDNRERWELKKQTMNARTMYKLYRKDKYRVGLFDDFTTSSIDFPYRNDAIKILDLLEQSS